MTTNLTKSYGTLTIAAGKVTIDLSEDVSYYTLQLTANITGWIISNLPAAGTYKEIDILYVQHASAAKTVAALETTGRAAGGFTASVTTSSRQVVRYRFFGDGTVSAIPFSVEA